MMMEKVYGEGEFRPGRNVCKSHDPEEDFETPKELVAHVDEYRRTHPDEFNKAS